MEHTEDSDLGFEAFDLDPRLVEALADLGFETPTPIQARALPPLLEGKDVLGLARTGSGKTAAFGLPLIERVKDGAHDRVRALVLCPTRELALQVSDAFQTFAAKVPVRMVTVYGGAGYGPQLAALSKGVAVVVGTPGRVLDHVRRGTLDLSSLEMLVLDEADEMLRMGFFEDVEEVLKIAPPDRQMALFSATMPPRIRDVVASQLSSPVEVRVEGKARFSVDHIAQKAMVVPERFKLDALTRVLQAEPIEAAIVFVRTRAGCASTADALASRGLAVDALHGDLNQPARERVLTRFRAGGLRFVVATDVASRGIDVERISHVINYDMPTAVEDYVHRIGRTGRAGREGTAISLVAPDQIPRVRFFQKALQARIARVELPTDAAIDRAQREALRRELAEGTSTAGAAALVETLLGDEGDPRRLAEVAVGLLAGGRGLDLDREASDEPPDWARPRERGDRVRPEDEVELFFPVGRRDRVRPGDLVGALANDAGVPGARIGRVTIRESKSFVRVEREAAERLLREHGSLDVRGRSYPLARSRPRGRFRPKPPRPFSKNKKRRG
jgi:ATP-dependent RNA helicase DeaD